MVTMTVIPHAGPMTREDLEKFRSAQGESSVRYELLDGCIVVTPAPGRWHQTVAFELARRLREQQRHGWARSRPRLGA